MVYITLHHAASWISQNNTVKCDQIVHTGTLKFTDISTIIKILSKWEIAHQELLAIFPPKVHLILIFQSIFHSLPLFKKKKNDLKHVSEAGNKGVLSY